MIVRADYHMHTKFSGDSKNELESIVKKAIEIGLEEIAITDHGPAHNGYGIKKENYPILRADIDKLNLKYPQINILLGLEANILGINGEIDIDEEMWQMIDWVNAGYHFGSNLKKDYKIHIYNILSKFSKHFYEKAKKINTIAMVTAIEKNKINMVTHPGAKGPIDIDAVAEAAANKGTLLEINNSHGHLTIEEIKAAMKYPVNFAVCSDAHEVKNVGSVSNALDRAYIAGVDKTKIYNVK
ncbi:PHP domain-containing protein [Fusibacter bizertensis]|jgi:Histidinol phosphatase and related hydrolases of the PHP family|uniref:PHP domain-containing protein n=1 Tax=Fusibacter bizertensis TaxID=1488331 RepID=A0ABT6NB65_9FIRM|nr:PHP domain-containing protein [Fusibacter bizertensis]MDH8677657.1 PHP domain-containing protein [Fusibacter bizertensis]